MKKGSLQATLRAYWELIGRTSAPTVLDAMLGRLSVQVCDERIHRLGEACIRLAEIDLRIEGQEHLQPGRTYLFMSNHQSFFDIPVLFVAVPGSLRMVTKTELFKVPIWGKALKVSGFVEIDRSNRARAIASLKEAARRMQEGINIWIAPEGTRSRTGALGPFKKGGFMLAIETGATIMPVSIEGTYEVAPPKTWALRKGCPVRLRFHAPIEAADYGVERREELMQRVREAIESGLDVRQAAEVG